MAATPQAAMLMQEHDMCLLVCIHASIDVPTNVPLYKYTQYV